MRNYTQSQTNSKKTMAFLIYKKYGNAETIRYEKLQSLKLGGRDGLIAKHVKTLTGDAPRSWKLGVSGLLKLAGFAGAVDELAVLFDVTGNDATNVCLYELSRIHGSCADTSTQLALSGGPGGGDWKWIGTSLQLGATVVQAQHGHGHGTGEPCPSCTCGRREAMNK